MYIYIYIHSTYVCILQYMYNITVHRKYITIFSQFDHNLCMVYVDTVTLQFNVKVCGLRPGRFAVAT